MTAPSGRTPRGRRDNGLDASEYAAAADVDPRVGEHLLDVLAIAGIAAYLQPSSDLHPVTRTTTLPNRPTDRLFVDRRHLAEARDVIGRLDLGTGAPAGRVPATTAGDETDADRPSRRRRRDDLDLDAAWQQILASWEAPAVEPTAPGPAATGATPGPDAPGEPTRPDDSASTEDGPTAGPPTPVERRRTPREPAPVVGLDVPFDPHELVEDPDDEGYEPPAPPPVPRLSRYTVLAVALVAVGLLLFFRPSLLPVQESAALVVGVAGILGGFGTLVWRLHDGLSDDDDPDDGAVV
jgi:hypothetical protein